MKRKVNPYYIIIILIIILFSSVIFHLLKSQPTKKECNNKTISEVENLVKITVSPSFNYNYNCMTNGVLQHLDRNYTYDIIPNELINGILFQGIHRPPVGTTVTIEILKSSTIYFFFHNKFDGGYTKIFSNLNNWKQSKTAPQYDIYNGTHGLKMIMYEINAKPGIYKIPPTIKDKACFSIVIQD